ncbi:hypothetical protein J6590_012313 [Homalodisca vitripennis]|nr:hypothetical protein J6590_012313 [Homalodisca vitripennis]
MRYYRLRLQTAFCGVSESLASLSASLPLALATRSADSVSVCQLSNLHTLPWRVTNASEIQQHLFLLLGVGGRPHFNIACRGPSGLTCYSNTPPQPFLFLLCVYVRFVDTLAQMSEAPDLAAAQLSTKLNSRENAFEMHKLRDIEELHRSDRDRQMSDVRPHRERPQMRSESLCGCGHAETRPGANRTSHEVSNLGNGATHFNTLVLQLCEAR